MRGFVRLLCQVISFGATAEAVRDLPTLIDAKESVRVTPTGGCTSARTTPSKTRRA
ncbi:hypothetical protein FHR83_006187 [Actinoplanes campanulatus]|uniref:Uncharacterized protein n=1 Tax=Actinoplanes campanulatus TaxID=113559 RepID=A0A7W5ALK0_9ACTN|nr:hypothetical protein [Actinoplanes campanulatus]MBB3098488.1 hypothetical protein [Actinoplanes campanulatus]GGN35499.1 hypothetical protein GCM10010109_59590 [Actinoplanes campanulatus]GID39182.1 hypothetical protein Aca09nite_56880 [Actinoplanes campanulatus]